ncbi:MAG: hypothetical protein ACRCVX_02425 [Shewanella sp.]
MSYKSESFYLHTDNIAFINGMVDKVKQSGDRPRFNKSVCLDEVLTELRKKSEPKQSKKPKAPVVTEQAVMWIPLNSGEYAVTKSSIDKWAQLYPAVDVVAELRGMIGWSDANPAKRKTASGIERFINSWLKKAQDKGGTGYRQQAPQQGWSEDLGL